MSYLAQLKALNSGADAEMWAPSELTKPTEATFVSFVSDPTAPFSLIGDPGSDAPFNPDAARRRACALTLLATDPGRQIAVIAEAPKPGEAVGHVCTAIRGVAVGDIAIPAEKYDAFALLALMEQHGHA